MSAKVATKPGKSGKARKPAGSKGSKVSPPAKSGKKVASKGAAKKVAKKSGRGPAMAMFPISMAQGTSALKAAIEKAYESERAFSPRELASLIALYAPAGGRVAIFSDRYANVCIFGAEEKEGNLTHYFDSVRGGDKEPSVPRWAISRANELRSRNSKAFDVVKVNASTIVDRLKTKAED